MNTIDYFFSLSSVWSYLVSERVKDLVAHHGMKVRYLPVFSLGTEARPPHTESQVGRAGSDAGIREASTNTDSSRDATASLAVPNTDLATRIVLAAQHQGVDVAPLIDKLLRAQWCEEQSVADEAALRTILHAARLDDELLLEKAGTERLKLGALEIARKARGYGMNGNPLWVYRDEVFHGPSSLVHLAQAIWRHNAHSGSRC